MAPTGDSRRSFFRLGPLRSGNQLSLLTIDRDPTGDAFSDGEGFGGVALCFAAPELGTQSGNVVRPDDRVHRETPAGTDRKGPEPPSRRLGGDRAAEGSEGDVPRTTHRLERSGQPPSGWRQRPQRNDRPGFAVPTNTRTTRINETRRTGWPPFAHLWAHPGGVHTPRRRTSKTVTAISSTDRASNQPPSIHWNGQKWLTGSKLAQWV
jgi:hypothetical protein